MVSIGKHATVRVAAVVLACMVALAAWLAVQPVEAAYAADNVKVYRVYNQWSNEHFYTSDQNEYKGLVAKGWTDEGVGWVAPASGDAVYRLYNKWSGDHHFTTDKSEYDKCVKAGWTGENVAFFSAGDSGLPVYRLFNPYETKFFHHYTMSESEYKKCQKAGWEDEGVGWTAAAMGWGPAPSTGGSANAGSGSSVIGDTVYITPSGNAYHRTKDCASLKNSKTILTRTLSQVSGSHSPCKLCYH